MRQTRSARVLLMRAADAVLDPILGGMRLHGVHFAEGGTPEGGSTSPPKQDDKPARKKIELTEEELRARIDAARTEAEQKAAEAKKKADDDAAAEEARKKGEWETLANTEKGKREESDRKAAEAERRAQLAEVSVQLRDYLANNEKLRDYVTNAPDIMLHVKEKLAPDAKPDAIAKLIEAEAKAFVERTPRKQGGGPPPAPSRSGARGDNIPATTATANGAGRRPFATIRSNY